MCRTAWLELSQTAKQMTLISRALLATAASASAVISKLLRGTVGVVLVVGGSTLARANEVTDWNDMLFRASVVASGSASPLNITRTSALVEAAVFDAVNGIEMRYTPFTSIPEVPPMPHKQPAQKED